MKLNLIRYFKICDLKIIFEVQKEAAKELKKRLHERLAHRSSMHFIEKCRKQNINPLHLIPGWWEL